MYPYRFLTEIFAEYSAESMPLNLLCPQRRQLPRRVEAFMRWITQVLKPHLHALGVLAINMERPTVCR